MEYDANAQRILAAHPEEMAPTQTTNGGSEKCDSMFPVPASIEPDPGSLGCEKSDERDQSLEEEVALGLQVDLYLNSVIGLYIGYLRTLSVEERLEWRDEVLHALERAEGKPMEDPELAFMVRVLRATTRPGRCLRCRTPYSVAGRHWCDRCTAEFPRITKWLP